MWRELSGFEAWTLSKVLVISICKDWSRSILFDGRYGLLFSYETHPRGAHSAYAFLNCMTQVFVSVSKVPYMTTYFRDFEIRT
jgi:hypothetical protein